MPPSQPNCTWVKNFNLLTFSTKKGKNRVKLGPKLRSSNLLAVKCLYGGTSLCKLEVQSIFAILVRKGFITESKMYDGAFLQKKLKRLLAFSFLDKNSTIDVQIGSKYF